ncbi:MAG: 4-diphosphocytidyl-2C-methyl-D-erythritol kinase [Candidatus Marinimicrobia bacterium]|nr:4-diphosphocytidyl-2C-methyl-D-erythritol kinase [Candidatus Neomarinimicrobiota bacterium]
MKFGPVPITKAQGLVLGHTFRQGGTILKKGHVISAADIAAFRALGVEEVIGARLEPGDISENAAALHLAQELCGDNITISDARTGRCNLIARGDGLVLLNASEIHAINQIDESITLATLADKAHVKAGQVVATVKIIPFAVSQKTLNYAEDLARHTKITLSPYKSKNFSILSTLVPDLKESVVSSTEALTRQRIKAIGGKVISSFQTTHGADDIAKAVRKAEESKTDVLLIIGAYATVDRGDVGPMGVIAAGGVIDHFGMPVDPGNLLVLGRVGQMLVLILPGCARSPKLNGVDWVMQHIAANITIGGTEIMSMGVGGLLVDTPARPLPRERAVADKKGLQRPTIAALVLAAGQSRRMEGQNKLLMQIDGIPLVRHTVERIIASNINEIVVVTGHQDNEILEALKGLKASFVYNSLYAEGLSTSLTAGIRSLDVDAVLVCLGDMPAIGANHINRLISEFSPENGRAIGVPVHNGKRGNPVLWARCFFDEMCDASGDVGARHLIGAHEGLVYEVQFGDTAVLTDLDTPAQWSDYLS